MPTCAAIVVAAGRGARFGGDQPKQYAGLAGVPLLRHALAAFCQHPSVQKVIPVIHPDDSDLFREAAKGLNTAPPVAGGETRQDSVHRGLETLAEEPPSVVLIHDGARPNLGHGVIDRVLAAIENGIAGAVPVLPVPDTLKRTNEKGAILETVDRSNVVRALTPQGFLFVPLLQAHRDCAGMAMTDDAALLEQSGHAVGTVEGHWSNIKVTSRLDLEQVAEAMTETRVGSGFDVHRFGPGNGFVLGGVPIPFDQGLVGHSDADVLLHAATDAVLGALADGDIGVHFPPSDPGNKDAPSQRFFQFAMDRLSSRLGTLVHLDITVICERPRLSPYREQLRAAIADIAGVPVSRVSVKATTTEGLGFTGRGEGIACQASATVRAVPVA